EQFGSVPLQEAARLSAVLLVGGAAAGGEAQQVQHDDGAARVLLQQTCEVGACGVDCHVGSLSWPAARRLASAVSGRQKCRRVPPLSHTVRSVHEGWRFAQVSRNTPERRADESLLPGFSPRNEPTGRTGSGVRLRRPLTAGVNLPARRFSFGFPHRPGSSRTPPHAPAPLPHPAPLPDRTSPCSPGTIPAPRRTGTMIGRNRSRTSS